MEEEKEETTMDLVGMNAKSAFDAYFLELMEGARQIRSQQNQLFAASVDNVRNLQQAHGDHVRNSNVLADMTLQGTKILQEKGLDTTAHEIAAETASVAAALAAMNSTNRQTDSTDDALVAAIAQLRAALDNFGSSS
mgnify:CR=1 FL=1